jgi:capsid protein
MQAASHDPLFEDWSTRLEDPNKVTSRSAKIVAARAQALVEDWDIAAALVRAVLLATHGAKGLRFRSHFQEDDAPETTEQERTARRLIEGAIRSRPDIDAGGTMTRRKLERQQDWHAMVMGDGYLVRVDQGISRWRLVHPFRVRNPKCHTNDERWQDGHEFGADGRPVALWVDSARASDLTLPASDPVRIPWTSPDGTRNVSHRKRWEIPGSVRGLSSFAPLMLPARMLQGVSEAYVAAKRVQAQIPLLMKVPDIEKAREQYRGSRLANLLMGPQSEIQVLQWKFEGADYQAFTDTELRSICAAMGIPWELVLNDHSAKSGASARSMWQSFYQQADEWQLDHAEQTSRPIDESIVRERQIAAPIPGLTDDWNRNMAGVYQGPARIMPDPMKEAQAAEVWDRLNRSRSSAFADQGWDYREEVMQNSQDNELDEAQGVEPEPEQPTAPMPAEPTEPDDADEPKDDQPEQADAMAKDDDMRASDVVKIVQAMTARESQPVQIIQRMEVGADSAKILGEAIAANMPQHAAPVVNVAAPSVTVEAAQVSVPAPVVTVNVPQQAAPVVMTAAQPAPVVHVHVPEQKPRKQRAVEQKDGSVILEDVE